MNRMKEAELIEMIKELAITIVDHAEQGGEYTFAEIEISKIKRNKYLAFLLVLMLNGDDKKIIILTHHNFYAFEANLRKALEAYMGDNPGYDFKLVSYAKMSDNEWPANIWLKLYSNRVGAALLNRLWPR